VLHFDFNAMALGIVTSFIVFPPVLLAIMFFKKSRIFSKRKNRIDLGLEKGSNDLVLVIGLLNVF